MTSTDIDSTELLTDPSVEFFGRIHNVDCIAGMNDRPAGSVDLVFADPPFNIGYRYDVYHDSLDDDQYIAWSREWITAVYRILKDDGAFWLAIGDEYAAELKIVARQSGFTCRSWVIWYYTFGVHCKLKFTRSHAHLFHFVKNPDQFTFNVESIRVPSARQLVYNDRRANATGRLPDDTWILRPQDLVDGFNADEDIWYFPRVAGTFKERAGFHGCQMPEQLLGRIVRACSNPGDTVVDPFSGSATTVVVAKKLGRQFAAFDLSEDYVNLGIERLSRIAVGDQLDGSEDPRVSVPGSHEGKKSKARKTAVVNEMPLFADFDSGRLDNALLSQCTAQLLTALKQTHDGYSVDRMVADPVRNEDFQTACDRATIPGTPAERNRELFRLRKLGELKKNDVDTSRVTAFTWAQMSRYMFASEIAWRQLRDEHPTHSLEEFLADPRLAAQFDELAARYAPGFRPLEYRWGAISLRKQLAVAQVRSSEIGCVVLADAVMWERLGRDPDALPATPGVYVIRDNGDGSFYVGETMNLRQRMQDHFGNELARRHWTDRGNSLEVAFSKLATVDDHRLARRCVLVNQYRPVMNVVEAIQDE